MGVKRKRRRPPTTGEYVGRAAAIRELARQEREMALEARRTRASGPPSPVDELDQSSAKRRRGAATSSLGTSEMGVRALRTRALADVEAVISVASKSSNLKGTYVRALKEATQSIAGVTEALASRTREVETLR